MRTWPTTRGVIALGDDREATLELGQRLARESPAESVVVHVAHPGQDRHFVSMIRAAGPVDELAKAVEPIGTHGVWEAEFRRVRDHGRGWPASEPTPGAGMAFGIWRHPDLDHAAFDAHWRDVHAPLALEHHAAMWDYTQCSFRGPKVAHAADYDAIAICQFPTLVDLEQHFFASPESERIIGEDVVRFGDPRRLHRVRTTEYVLR